MALFLSDYDEDLLRPSIGRDPQSEPENASIASPSVFKRKPLRLLSADRIGPMEPNGRSVNVINPYLLDSLPFISGASASYVLNTL